MEWSSVTWWTPSSEFAAQGLSALLTFDSGNQGTDFRYVPREGFGWMNCASNMGYGAESPTYKVQLPTRWDCSA